jgi:hypothetical protein
MLRSAWKSVAIVLAAGVIAASPARAQLVSGPIPVSLGVNYVADLANGHPGSCGCFTMQGGGVNVALGMTKHFSAVADFSVVHAGTVPGANYGLGLITLMAGPQYSLPTHGVTPYVQALLGGVRGFDSVFPGNVGSSSGGVAFELGTGVTVRLNHRFSIRAVELDYLRTGLPNNTNNWQNHLKIATGLVYHF